MTAPDMEEKSVDDCFCSELEEERGFKNLMSRKTGTAWLAVHQVYKCSSQFSPQHTRMTLPLPLKPTTLATPSLARPPHFSHLFEDVIE
jgi:hypothetical protein